MKKIKINYIVNAGLAISFLSVSVTGLMKFPGFLALIGISFRSIPGGILRIVSPLHDWSGIIMIFLAFVHLALHWRWIYAATREIFFRRA